MNTTIKTRAYSARDLLNQNATQLATINMPACASAIIDWNPDRGEKPFRVFIDGGVMRNGEDEIYHRSMQAAILEVREMIDMLADDGYNYGDE